MRRTHSGDCPLASPFEAIALCLGAGSYGFLSSGRGISTAVAVISLVDDRSTFARFPKPTCHEWTHAMRQPMVNYYTTRMHNKGNATVVLAEWLKIPALVGFKDFVQYVVPLFAFLFGMGGGRRN
jgi:hypothetical protein